ncbi:MAG: hypothetical protein AAGH19_07220 [Pseudomonadota bacterium]
MSRTSINHIDTDITLSSTQQRKIRGGMGMWTPWGFVPYIAPPTSPHAFGFGGFRNVFTPGTLGFGIQAGTFNMQAGFAQHNSNWMSNFRSGW